MTLQEFIDKHNGKFVEVAGPNSKNQCVDLANKYLQEVLGQEIVPFADASMFPARLASRWNWILYTPERIPSPGDLVIWDGIVGHIAIFIEGDTNRFTSFDQNYPVGSPAHVQAHTYLRPKVLGWLHPKESMSTVSLDSATFEKLVTNSSRYDEFCKIGYTSAAQVEKEVNDLKTALSDKNLTIEVEEQRANEARKELNELITACAKALNTVQETTQIKATLVKTSDQLDQLDDLQRNFAELQLHSSEQTESLRAEIARWKAIAEQTSNLGDYETATLIKEIIRRFVKVINLAK
jgi:hypothetical protein